VPVGITLISGNTTCLTPQSLLLPAMCPNTDNHAANDQWLLFRGLCSGTLEISTSSSNGGSASFDTHLSVWTGPPQEYLVCPWGIAAPGFTEIACNDDDPLFLAGESTVVFPVSAGELYYVRVAGHAMGQFGAFELAILNTPDYQMIMDQPSGPLSYRVRTLGGTANDRYFWVLSADPANMGAGLGTGGWFGLHIPLQEVLNQYFFGYPFVGLLDANGESDFSVTGTSSFGGLVIWGVAITINPATGQLRDVSCPVESQPLF
jgi:hypothetical protein